MKPDFLRRSYGCKSESSFTSDPNNTFSHQTSFAVHSFLQETDHYKGFLMCNEHQNPDERLSIHSYLITWNDKWKSLDGNENKRRDDQSMTSSGTPPFYSSVLHFEAQRSKPAPVSLHRVPLAKTIMRGCTTRTI